MRKLGYSCIAMFHMFQHPASLKKYLCDEPGKKTFIIVEQYVPPTTNSLIKM